MQLFSRFLPVSCLLAVALPAAAAQGAYVEGNVGLDYPDLFEFAGADDDLSIPTLGLRAGYEFNETWSVEGDFRIGLDDGDTSLTAIGEQGEVGLNAAAGVFVRSSVPLGDSFSAHARLGAVLSEYESEIVGLSSNEVVDQYTGVGFGIGATLDLSEDLYLRTDFTVSDTPGELSSDFTIGAGLKF